MGSKTSSKRDYLNITTLYSTKWKVPLAGFASSWKEMDAAKVRESRSPTSTLEPSLQWQVKPLVQWDEHFSNMESPFQLQQQHQHYVVLLDKHNLLENPTSFHCKKWNAVESKNLSLKHASENTTLYCYYYYHISDLDMGANGHEQVHQKILNDANCHKVEFYMFLYWKELMKRGRKWIYSNNLTCKP